MGYITRFASWLIDPFIIKPEPQEDTSFLEVTETPITFNPFSSPVSVFKPTTFAQYVGQDKAKSLLQNYISGTITRKRPFPHTLICGQAGYGKTTLARIIAHQLNLSITEVIGNEANSESIGKLVGKSQLGILFIDEIHAVERASAEQLYPLMEDFTYKGQSVAPFTLIGATTEVGEILKDKKPFYDRFKIIINLTEYTIPELASILKQYKTQVFPQDKLSHKIYYTLARNCRNTPRHGIRLLEATIYANGNIQDTFYTFDIVKDGYTSQDLYILKYLSQNPKGLGLKGLTAYLNISEDNYTYAIEPYLLKTGLLMRTARGRIISEKGIQLVQELEKEQQHG